VTLIISSSNIIDQIDNQRLGALAYFYFTFRRNERQDLRNLMHSLLAQLVRGLVREDEQQPQLYHVPRAYQELYDKYVLESEPKIEDLQETFLRVMAQSRATYIVIDALDECPQIKDRYKILKFLAELSSTSSSAHILVTSRREEDIQDTINAISLSAKVTEVPIQNSQVDDDIRRHVQFCLADDLQFQRWAKDVKAEVTDNLANNASGVFKWVECQLVILGPKKRKQDVLETLKQLPKDLDETYARMLAHIDSSGYQKEAHAVLQWLAFSNRPLTLEEAAEAAIFDQEEDKLTLEAYPVSFNTQCRFQNAVDIQNILSQLVIVSENGQISFAHFSVKEYLMCDRVEPAYRLEEHLAHRFILESCLVYMQSYFSLPPRPLDKEDWEGFPLLYYSCQYWPDHARQTFAAKVRTQNTDKLVRALFQSETSFISSLKISSSDPKAVHRLFHSETEFASRAWFLAYHNLEYILRLLQNANEVMNLGVELKFDGLVALHVAAGNGYDDIASLLLDIGAEIEAKDQSGQTALHLASSAGHDRLVRLLLQRGANIMAKNLDERTPLHLAAMEGHETVLEALASQMRKEDLEMRDLYGLTALHLAVRFAEWRGASGESTVKKLLESGSRAKTRSNSGKTAIQDVADYDNVQILSLLKAFGGGVYIRASTTSE
jgi:ankyrin repeat protein